MAMERKETMSYHQALSLERHRLLWLFLNEESDFYIHCKRKYCTLPLSKHFTNYSETKKIWIILQLIYSLLADVKQTSVICPLNQYDVILCNHVLEHIPDDTKAMQELYRVLKPGGWPFYKSSRAIKSCNFSDDTITDQKNER
jgi:SAM-dependent methyltransferase